MSDINVQELATKVVEELKKSPEKLKTFAANNEVLKGILGDDGKLRRTTSLRVFLAKTESLVLMIYRM